MTDCLLFHDYFKQWIELYKLNAVREVTFKKYRVTHSQLVALAPQLKINEITRMNYQQLLNKYAVNHEKRTTSDFHHQLKSALLDALDEGLIERDPTRKAVIKGTLQRKHKAKFLNQNELTKLLRGLELTEDISWDWFILLVAKTGLRYGEALGLTSKDFDFRKSLLTINKTWNYKSANQGFAQTKNQSSVRKINLDKETARQFRLLIKDLPKTNPIFVPNKTKIFNEAVNKRLEILCAQANIPIISLHGLRHTHASLLLYAGVSTASVAKRLGHSNIGVTQKTYLHIIRELEIQDSKKIMKYLGNLCL
ncbi:MAG: site-specific integrase [Micrococcaceae bacterium]